MAGIIALIPNRNHLDVFYWLNGIYNIPSEDFWGFVTVLSNGLVSFAMLLPFVRKNPRNVLAVCLAAALFTLIDHAVKFSGTYRRPARLLDSELIHIVGPLLKRRSFPSGHASMIMSLVAVWVFTHRSKWLKIVLIPLGLVIAASRTIVGAHWPVDVSVGIAIGWFSGYVGLLLATRWSWIYRPRHYRIFALLLVLTGVVSFVIEAEAFSPLVVWSTRILCFSLTVWGATELRRIWPVKSDL